MEQIESAKALGRTLAALTVPLWFLLVLTHVPWDVACIVCTVLALAGYFIPVTLATTAFDNSPEGQAYAAAMAQQAREQAAREQEAYRYQLEEQAIHDWFNVVGDNGPYPSAEWVVNRMHDIQQGRAAASYQQQQLRWQQAQVATGVAMFVQQQRTINAVNNLPREMAEAQFAIRHNLPGWDKYNL